MAKAGEGWVPTERSGHLRNRKSRNTSPELRLRSAVHAEGARLRLHRKLAKGCTPDFVLPGRRIAVFVDGCWWHSCPHHGRKVPFTGPNAKLWEQKMLNNKERDLRSTRLARELGWKVFRVRECEIDSSPAKAAERILSCSERDSF